MPTSLGFLSDDRIDEARDAARVLLAYRKPNRKLAEPLTTLADLGNETLRHLDMLSAIACKRDVAFEVLYRRPDTPHIVQTFSHKMEDIPVLLPLDDEPRFETKSTNPFAVTRQGQDFSQASHDVRSLVQLDLLRNQQQTDFTFVIMPRLFKFAAHWFKNIEGDMVKFTCGVTRPGQRASVQAAYVYSIEGNA